MKISAVDNTNFGMAVKATPQAKEYLAERLTDRGLKKFKELVKFAENDSVDVNLSTETRHLCMATCPELEGTPYNQLIVEVGDKYSYKPEGFSFFILRAIKNAVKEAHEYSEHKKLLDEIL
ncbi:hypothetical protein IJI31_03510 [bacterium]|nr:hypothetical protein [bacterium]